MRSSTYEASGRYKVALLGELGVGKTSMFRRLNGNAFVEFDEQRFDFQKEMCVCRFEVEGGEVSVSWKATSVQTNTPSHFALLSL